MENKTMAKTTKKDEQFTNVIVPAIITATSNKIDEDFKQETPTKTVYFNVTDKAKIKELEELGLTCYTPKDKDGKPYFICKATKDVKIYFKDGSTVEKMFTTITIDPQTMQKVASPNLFTDTEVVISVIKVKGGKGKNDFFRINAILLDDIEELKQVEQTNPFADLIGK